MHRVICDFLLEIVGNSLEAGASHVELEWIESGSLLKWAVRDNGKGMSPAEIERLEDPYFTDPAKHETRRAGLGIPFLAQTLEMTGGAFSVESEKGRGTTVSCEFCLDHIDTPPVGNVAEAIAAIMTMAGEYELVVHRVLETEGRDYLVLRSSLIEALGELESVDSQQLLRTYIESCEQE